MEGNLFEALAKDYSARGLPVSIAIARLLMSALAGLAVARIFTMSAAREGRTNRPFATALLLLCVLVAMTTMVIDDSIARAFSLVGALAIVRFRTDVEDSRDTAFVIFAVVCGMASGIANWQVCVFGIPLVGLLAFLGARPGSVWAPPGVPGSERTLLVRVGAAENPRGLLEAAIRRHATDDRLARAATSRQGASLELTWRIALRPESDPVALVAELNAVPGVQHVEFESA
ncbi:MAG: DUF4956 domain-containing protein [Candidatus Brocadiae bacterium]|nr:DUF4956 domain-containing protein [Candidatus Brocadiia bacterium]